MPDDPVIGWRPPGPLALLDPRARSLGCAGCGACCESIILGWDPRESPTDFVREHWTVEWADDHGQRHGRRWEQRGYVVTCDAYDPVNRRCTAHTDRPSVCRDYPHYNVAPSSTVNGAERTTVDDQDGVEQPYGCSYLLDSPGWSHRGRPLIPLEVVSRTT